MNTLNTVLSSDKLEDIDASFQASKVKDIKEVIKAATGLEAPKSNKRADLNQFIGTILLDFLNVDLIHDYLFPDVIEVEDAVTFELIGTPYEDGEPDDLEVELPFENLGLPSNDVFMAKLLPTLEGWSKQQVPVTLPPVTVTPVTARPVCLNAAQWQSVVAKASDLFSKSTTKEFEISIRATTPNKVKVLVNNKVVSNTSSVQRADLIVVSLLGIKLELLAA